MRSLPNSQSTSAASLPHSNGMRKPASPGVGPASAAGSSPSGAFAALGLNSPPATSTLSGPTSPAQPPAQQQAASSSSSAAPPTGASDAPKASPAAPSAGGGGVVETAKGLLGALWGMGGGSAATQTMGHQAQQSPQNEGAPRRP
jgi:hypothetical protein